MRRFPPQGGGRPSAPLDPPLAITHRLAIENETRSLKSKLELGSITRAITISGLATAILFYLSVMTSASVGDESIESGIPENMGIAFGILILAILEPDVWVVGLTPPPPPPTSARRV